MKAALQTTLRICGRTLTPREAFLGALTAVVTCSVWTGASAMGAYYYWQTNDGQDAERVFAKLLVAIALLFLAGACWFARRLTTYAPVAAARGSVSRETET